LNFSKPLSVSAGKTPDEVTIYLAYVYQGELRQKYLFGDLPQQVKSAEELKTLNEMAGGLGGATKYMFWIYLGVNVLFSFALGMLWASF
jgi:hypothetical protein